MTAKRTLRQRLFGQTQPIVEVVSAESRPRDVSPTEPIALDFTPGDPLWAYLESNARTVDVDTLNLQSPALEQLRQAGVKLVMPLVSQGELIGLVNLGDRMSEQQYASDDRRLLDDLATQVAPAVRVAQLVRQQQLEARERSRIEYELRVARVIQQTLLPREIPALDGWQLAAHYQPAREVGGDFYDFLRFPDGRLGIIIADVTDKGVPAAMVMATTRSILRAAAERLVEPGAVLERTNEVLCPDIPPKMFVTCCYAVLDPASGVLRFANAGHDLPYRRRADGVDELRATGMPLGLLPGMGYEEKEVVLQPGDTVVFHSDGIAEAHDPQRDMFGFPRLKACIADGAQPTIAGILATLQTFTGADWEQEDDVTLVTLRREEAVNAGKLGQKVRDLLQKASVRADGWHAVEAFAVDSAPGNERQAMQQVAAAIAGSGLQPAQVERLKTAVAEATMNAMEHGNKYDPEKPVAVGVWQGKRGVRVTITDQGGGKPLGESAVPDLTAKLAGEQSPRGWGLFLIQNMVDEMHVHSDDDSHTIELIVQRAEEK